jgi:1,2-diacylglycerol 3-alpha-glucosyltransferase
MRVACLFINIGSYHVARLQATHQLFETLGWQLMALQMTGNTLEHPWGDLAQHISFPLQTLWPNANPQSLDKGILFTALARVLDEMQLDAVAIPGWGFAMAQAALKWAKSRRVPAIVMSESKWDDEPRQWWKEALKSALYVKKFDAALVGSQAHRDYLVQLGMPKSRISLGYDAVDNDYFAQRAAVARSQATAIQQSYPGMPRRSYFIAIARFIERKNVLHLLQAYAQYRQLVPLEKAWDLVLCGSGEQEQIIRQQISEQQLIEFVHLPGFLSYQVLPDWLALAGGLIHPAYSEQWGLVVNEAMAAGVPVIVSNRCGCFPELIIEAETGFGFDPADASQLVQRMLKVSAGEFDAHRMQQLAWQQVQKYSSAVFASGLKQAVDCALAHASSSMLMPVR